MPAKVLVFACYSLLHSPSHSTEMLVYPPHLGSLQRLAYNSLEDHPSTLSQERPCRRTHVSASCFCVGKHTRSAANPSRRPSCALTARSSPASCSVRSRRCVR